MAGAVTLLVLLVDLLDLLPVLNLLFGCFVFPLSLSYHDASNSLLYLPTLDIDAFLQLFPHLAYGGVRVDPGVEETLLSLMDFELVLFPFLLHFEDELMGFDEFGLLALLLLLLGYGHCTFCSLMLARSSLRLSLSVE